MRRGRRAGGPCSHERCTELSRTSRRALLAVAAVVIVVIGVVIATRGSSDGPAAFLSHDDESAIFVRWTRTGEDVSGSLSVAQVTQAQSAAETGFFSNAPAPGQITQQTGAFTGTVRDDSVRLLIGSGAASNRVNGRLEGETLELTIPQDPGVLTRRLTPASHDDYAKAVQQIRDHERQRKAAAKAALARKQRGDRAEVTRVANAFQKALRPGSSDDPCRYVTSDVKERFRDFPQQPAPVSCATAIRQDDAAVDKPVARTPLGVAAIRFGALPPLGISLDGGPDGAIVTWRPKPAPDSFEPGRTTFFLEQNGRWLVYRCCP